MYTQYTPKMAAGNYCRSGCFFVGRTERFCSALLQQSGFLQHILCRVFNVAEGNCEGNEG